MAARSEFDDDKTHHGIEVFSFGYASKDMVDHPSPINRVPFDRVDIDRVRSVIDILFKEKTDRPFPISKFEYFNGQITYRPGWIRLASDTALK